MNKFSNAILIIGAVFLFFTNCQKEQIVTEYIEKEFSWKQHPNFMYTNSYQLNSFANDTCMVFYGLNRITTIGIEDFTSYTDEIANDVINNFLPSYDYSNGLKYAITPDFMVNYEEYDPYLEKGVVHISSTRSPNHSDYEIDICLPDIDKGFVEYNLVPAFSSECIVANDKKQILIPYLSKGAALNMLLVELKMYEHWTYRMAVDTVKTKIVKLNEGYRVRYLHTVDSDFYVGTDTKTYKIGSDGSVKTEHNYQFTDIIDKGDTLFAVAQNMSGYDFEFLRSVDRGSSWQTIVVLPSMYGSINYTVINDIIIGYRYSQLWEFTPTENGIEIKELDNYGLDGNYITSVVKYNDKVFVSSLSGVYYKDIEELFAEKIEEE